MLPLPNLDDRMFEQIIQDARKSIPKLLPEWTDENAHDPGITLMELLGWLTEMQQFHLNQITEANERKFLKLLGLRLQEASAARTDVEFGDVTRPLLLPAGTPLEGEDVVFELEHAIRLMPAQIEKVIVRTRTDTNDSTAANRQDGVSYYAFGPGAEAGNRFYIGFDRSLPADERLYLAVRLFEDYPVKAGRVGPGSSEFEPSAAVRWRCYAHPGDGSPPVWLPLELESDETCHLTQSGRLAFSLPAELAPLALHPAGDKRRYWLSATLEREGFELAPKIMSLSLHTAGAVQQETWAACSDHLSTGEAGQRLVLTDYLGLFGTVRVQVRESAAGWTDWSLSSSAELSSVRGCVLERIQEPPSGMVRFTGAGPSRLPPEGSRIRIVRYAPSFADDCLVGRSNGLPHQRFALQIPRIMPDSLAIQVGRRKPGTDMFVWEDWKQVEDFDCSGPYDRHYLFEPEEGLLIFGDHERGRIPEASDMPNIRIISCISGGGVRGNINRNLIRSIRLPDEAIGSLTVTNPDFASGGTDRETLEEAKGRVQIELKRPTRAVTNEDYEALVRSIPGLRVARVKALPLYEPGMRDYPRNRAPGQVTVVAVPYSEAAKPKPSEGFLRTVRLALEPFRLIGTELNVIGAEYIRITVHAVVVVEPDADADARRLADGLRQLLQPIGGGSGGETGWPFGRTVHKGDLYGVIHKFKGVAYVQDLWLDAEGRGFVKLDGGDVGIPPHALVYSGEHQIEFIRTTDLP